MKGMQGNTSKLTHGCHCHLNDACSVGYDADGGLDFGDGASLVEILSVQSFCACGPFLDGHTFQTQDL